MFKPRVIAKLRRIIKRASREFKRWARFSRISPWKTVWFGSRKTTSGLLVLLSLIGMLMLLASFTFLTRDSGRPPLKEGRFFSRFEEELYFEPVRKPILVPKVAPKRPLMPRGMRGVRIAIILDDAGASFVDYDNIFSIKSRFTISVLPGLPDSRRVVMKAVSAGKEAMLHLPMEPENEKYVRRGGDMVLVSMSDEEIAHLVLFYAASLPGIKGVNNHMGSLATQDPRVMDVVMSCLKDTGLFFIDSRTSSRSVAGSSAKKFHVPFARNMIFLDVDGTSDGVRMRFEQLVDLARKERVAVGIGHVTRKDTIRVLKELMPKYELAGIEFVYASSVVK